MAMHEPSVGLSDEWYTPPYIFEALGCSFDMDVASPGQYRTPWIPAEEFLTFKSLERKWRGFIWMNPPFGGRNALVPWLDKFFRHGNGIALVPDRTSAPWWQEFAPRSDIVLFVAPKIKFIDEDGNEGGSPSNGISLLTVGIKGKEALLRAKSKLGVVMSPIIGAPSK